VKADEARREAVKADEARREAVKADEARREAVKADEARREAVLRSIGRQLDEEAAQRDAARADAERTRLPSASPLRRGRLFGRTDANAELVLYAEAWARKIQLNTTFDLVRDAARRPHTPPVVTVAIRNDGSIESVSFVRSSGVPELDDAIRRVLNSLLPFPAFSPPLAREYDVIEIRRTWTFDMAIRLN
jgi:TonB family protein